MRHHADDIPGPHIPFYHSAICTGAVRPPPLHHPQGSDRASRSSLLAPPRCPCSAGERGSKIRSCRIGRGILCALLIKRSELFSALLLLLVLTAQLGPSCLWYRGLCLLTLEDVHTGMALRTPTSATPPHRRPTPHAHLYVTRCRSSLIRRKYTSRRRPPWPVKIGRAHV